MKRALIISSVLVLSLSSMASISIEAPSYTEQQHREIKALSESQIAGLQAGKGMGYARAAELNGYPGPMHVLELADELDLSATQLAETQALFNEMLSAAKRRGAELIEAERQLDQSFKSKAIDETSLSELTTNIGLTEARLRAVHLNAHMRQTQLLNEEQISKYMALRGYSSGNHGHHQQHQHQHQHQH